MRSSLSRYFPLSWEERKHLFQTATIVLDANVLLNVYKYSSAARDEFLDGLDHLGDRLWIPHQVGLEFFRNRSEVMRECREEYESYLEDLSPDRWKKLERGFTGARSSNASLPDSVESALATLREYVDEARHRHQHDLRPADWPEPILQRYEKLFDGRIQTEPSQECLNKLKQVAEERLQRKQPPGYKDAGKSNGNESGDYFIWAAMIEHAKAIQLPLIFVTNDRKDDWWAKSKKGEKQGPRHELIDEMWEKAAVTFHMFTAERFLQHLTEVLGAKASPETIDEIQTVSNRALSSPQATIYNFLKAMDDNQRGLAQFGYSPALTAFGNVQGAIADMTNGSASAIRSLTDPASLQSILKMPSQEMTKLLANANAASEIARSAQQIIASPLSQNLLGKGLTHGERPSSDIDESAPDEPESE